MGSDLGRSGVKNIMTVESVGVQNALDISIPLGEKAPVGYNASLSIEFLSSSPVYVLKVLQEA